MSSAMINELWESTDDFYTQAFEHNPTALLVIDDDIKVLQVNAAYEKLFQVKRKFIIGKKFQSLILSSDCYQHLLYNHRQRYINPGSVPSQYIIDLKFKDNRSLTVYISVTVLPNRQSIISILNMTSVQILQPRSFSSEKNLETEYSYIENLKTTSELAASVGHEIRNPMTSIRGFLQMMQKKSEYNQHKTFFDLMIEELDRANTIITEYLLLARSKPMKPNAENLNDLITRIMPLLKTSVTIINQDINTDLNEIPKFLMNGKEIRQLILNFVRNALEAMPNGGEVKITTKLENENTVLLSISDQGLGIPPEIIKKIGTPFFTTKENGTGLGLAICYNIAIKHNATINIDSSENGTTFYIRFQLK